MSSAPVLVVLDGYTLNPGDNPWDALARLGALTVYDRTAPDRIVERAYRADIVITNKTPLSADTLAQLPRVRFIAILATGVNVVDLGAARARGVPVANVPEHGTDAVAQHTFALLLELCPHVGAHDRAVHDGEWARCPDFSFWTRSPVELTGLTMGIVGLGRIGQRVGALAHAFGMSVLAASGTRRVPPPYTPFAWSTVPGLFATADVVSLHCPLTADNARFVNADLLARMKPTAFLVNAARGGLIDEAALAQALHAGRLAGAAVDVVSVEPMRPGNPLLAAPNCIITPHLAWASLSARRRLMATTVENVAAFLAGRPINVVDAEPR
jgi:glycerate dehydrogenase